MDRFINFAILGHPMNWVIILVMLLFWAFFFDLLQAQLSNRHPANAISS